MKAFVYNKSFLLMITILLTVLIRLPFLSNDISFNNDAAIYSRNIERNIFDGNYDVQVPGYVSYINTARLIYVFIKDTTIIQHVINIILVGLITLFLFELLILIGFDKKKTFIFTFIFSFNNILLLGSITGGNRLFLTLCSIILMFFAYNILIFEKKEFIIWFALIFGFFIGFRQDLSVYFLPLYIYLIYRIKDLKIIILSFFVFSIVCLCWFIPLMIEYGGISGFIERLTDQSSIYSTSIIFSGLKVSPLLNIFRIFIYLINSFLLLFPFLFFSIVNKELHFSKDLIKILLFSFLPAFIFQLVVHNGNYVHLAAFMTPFFIFLIYSYRLDSLKKTLFSISIIFLILFQFFGIKQLKSESMLAKAANILWFQYSYDGVKSGDSLRLKMLKDDIKR